MKAPGVIISALASVVDIYIMKLDIHNATTPLHPHIGYVVSVQSAALARRVIYEG